MPFTPFHFGPGSLVGLPLNRYLDFPVFILANVAVDIEPLAVMVFDLNYPVHGYFHTFLFGSLVGVTWAFLAWPFRGIFEKLMNLFRVEYSTDILKMLISGVLGVWLHVLFDAPLYTDIKPFFPLTDNPLYGIIGFPTVEIFCMICFLPAFLVYAYKAYSYSRSQ